jgi:sugar diacid utilization regulator
MILADVIDGKHIDAEEFSKLTASIGITEVEEFRCLALRIPLPSGNEFVHYFSNHLDMQVPALYVPANGEVIAMIIRASLGARQGIDMIPIMEEELRIFGLRVGLSDVYDDLLLSNHYFTQARYALEWSEAMQKDRRVSQFSDCCLDYILDHCAGDLKPTMLWNEGFRKLVRHDFNKVRANYVETLRAYLDNNLNAMRTAAALYISRNSFLSRIERVNALIGEDLFDPKVRFRYELSLLLYDKWKER